jgi:predicted nicotinamide N-methyase
VIWKAADILSKYILDYCQEIFRDKTILELGSGPGLCGLISANFAKKVILSDY